MAQEIDNIDKSILRALSHNGRITLRALAQQVGLSKSPVQQRLKALERSGVIAGYRAKIDPLKLGLDHVAFVQVKLSDTRARALKAFNDAASGIPEIEELHMIAGNFDFLIKLRCRDINSFRHILAEQISALPHLSTSSSFMAIEAIKERGDLAI